MAGSLPTVLGGAQALYPVTRSVEFLTTIGINTDASEQRSRARPGLTRFELPYSGIPKSDRDAMATFFDAQKGTYDSTWSFTLGSTTYNNLALEDDSFQSVERADAPLVYDFTIRARQTMRRGATTPTQGTALPVLASGNPFQLPYTAMRRFAVMRNDNPTGMRYAWNWFDGSGTFPAGALHGWTLDYSGVSDADLATLESFFRSQWGRWGQFLFTEPESSTTYANVRFDTDSMAIRHLELNNNAFTLPLLETN